jgi:formamidopyrimidine-DNA glycosylase
MPELPEVEFARRSLQRWLKGRKIVRSEAPDTRIFRGAERAAFASLRGRLVRTERRGKYLLLTFEQDRGLLSHLGMTGKWVRRTTADEPYSRARWFLDDGSILHYRDPRLFGRLEPFPASRLRELPVIRALGIDPLVEGLDATSLEAAIGHSRQPLKVALMDQSRVAGLGNIHAAEALFRAKLHPALLPEELSARDYRVLAKAILDGLHFALAEEVGEEISYVEEGGDNPFLIYGRGDRPCRRCNALVGSFVQGGRTTYFCPHCQARPLRSGAKKARSTRGKSGTTKRRGRG